MAETITETARLLVVSRESSVLRPLSSLAESHCWQIETAVTGWDAMERVQSGMTPHLLLLDLPRDNGDTLHVLRWLRRLRPELPVIVTCFPNDAERKNEALRLGAQDFLVRPFHEDHLEASIQRHLLPPAADEMEIASEDIEQVGPESYFVSAGPVSKKIRAQAELLAETDVPVLILGESGAGKDTVARLIHKLSLRSAFKFVKMNCSDMPAELLSAELLGTQANGKAARLGLLERAEKGTVFLHEITEIPLEVQSKVMAMLGGSTGDPSKAEGERSSNLRLIAATSANLDRAIAERRFREDLYYRLSAFTVQLAPLRQRKFEIPILLQHFMHKLSKHYGLPAREFSSAVLGACQQYSWPGNLKELENFVKRYLIGGEAELVSNNLQPHPVGQTGASRTARSTIFADREDSRGSFDSQTTVRSLKSLVHDVRSEAERNMIATALQKTGWNRKAAARLLQVSYRTLLYKIEQYHMRASGSFVSSQNANGNNGKTR